MRRRFQTDQPYQKIVSDVAEFKIPATQEKVYLEPIIDLYNNEILTYAITADSPNLEFALQPLNSLMTSIPNQPYKQFLHTDQGWQYRPSCLAKKA